jgi:hypothetical protein
MGLDHTLKDAASRRGIGAPMMTTDLPICFQLLLPETANTF